MPGIHLYASNRLEKLAEAFSELIKENPLPPFQKETVLVQSRGMARWLAMETAASMDIWANCDCPFPNSFVQAVFRLIYPELPAASSYSKEYVLWHIMEIFSGSMQNPHFSKAAAYLASGDELKLYQLARETADLFDQYTLFRPQMILAWEENDTELAADLVWQSVLWQKLVEHIKHNQEVPEQHRARLLHLFEQKITEPGFEFDQLPPRISVFGISSLPPYHLRILSLLAEYIDIYFYIMNPCREYWFDIIADRDQVKIGRREAIDPKALHLYQGNSLLAAMGHLGKDFMAMLQELQIAEHELFEVPPGDSLLSCIQQDILFLRENSDASPKTTGCIKQIPRDHESVCFHSCHSPMREVEILHDQLLALFDAEKNNRGTEPRHVIVMAPEIDEYAPLIRAVFDATSRATPKIPYTIADQSVRKTSKYLKTFLDILLLPQSRFSSIDIMGTLEMEAIISRFDISDSDLVLIEHWIRETKICWGIDQEHKSGLNLPPHPENTWREGLNRLLLGYAMPGNDLVMFNNILPYDDIEGDSSILLGKLLDFAETLFSLIGELQKQHSLVGWSKILLQIQKELLCADDNSENEERFLHRLLLGLEELQHRTSYNRKVSLRVIRSFLASSMDERFSPLAGESGFLAGGVTFCSMLPMRAIPFKVIYLLGMNDGIFPRPGRKRSFDLMALEPKRGDRSKRYDDRYLFLETLLSARQKLIISYVGQSNQDGTSRPPSVLVSELMDYIDRNYTDAAADNRLSTGLSNKLTITHHLQPFHPAYFQTRNQQKQEKFYSYSTENRDAAAALQTTKPETRPFFSAPLPPPPDSCKQVELQELIKFFSHPVRYILVKRIGIAPINESRTLETNEPFNLTGLERYRLANSMLDHLVKNREPERLYQIKKGAGELPHGELGHFYFTKLLAELRTFHQELQRLTAGHDLEKVPVDLAVGDFRITGFLNIYSDRGLVLYRYAAMTPKDIIRSWLSHLVFSSLQNRYPETVAGNTYYVSKKEIYIYSPRSQSNSHLEKLLRIYWQGLSEPLLFFPKTSFAYVNEIQAGRSERQALRKAAIAWHGDNYYKEGEKLDPYNMICCNNFTVEDSRFREMAKEIFLPALELREPGDTLRN